MISLGIDVGGTGCKCVAFQEDGQQLALGYGEYPNATGQVTLSVSVLQQAVMEVVSKCVKQLAHPEDVVAITISSFGESFVPVDAKGTPLTDIILYFADTESDDFDHLIGGIGKEQMMDIVSVLPDASYSLAKILHTQKMVKTPVWKYLFVASYLCYYFSGETYCDDSLACRSLLYDVANRCWSKELLEAAGVSESQMPTAVPTGTAIGTILPQWAGEFGISQQVKIVIGSHDQIVNGLGAGVAQVGDVVNTTGTCECITPLFATMQDLGFYYDNYACVPYLDNLGYVTYAYNISGGAVVKWYRDTLAYHLAKQAKTEGVSIYDLLNRTCPKEPTSLVILPYLQGMGGTPDVDTKMQGHFSGVTTNTTLPQLYRGILEGLCFEMYYNLERLQSHKIQVRRMMACGGGARSKAWLQIKADVWGCEILPVLTEETGALGSAILGFAAVTGEKNICQYAKSFVRHGDVIVPNMENHRYYQQQYAQFKKLRDFFRGYRLHKSCKNDILC